MKPRILVVGSVQADFCFDVSRFPEKGEELLDNGKREYRPGGRGAIAAATFSRLGADTLLCGKTGNDTEGARLKQSIVRCGIDTRFLISVMSSTPLALIAEAPPTAAASAITAKYSEFLRGLPSNA